VVPEVAALTQAMPVLRALRQRGVRVQMHAAGAEGMGSMKSQFKKADASGARHALVFGEQELAAGAVAVKPLRGERDAAAQATCALDDLDGLARRLRD
jgi:histidyl-tRNA synthetase